MPQAVAGERVDDDDRVPFQALGLVGGGDEDTAGADEMRGDHAGLADVGGATAMSAGRSGRVSSG
jgi:hypothetical protein